MAAERAMNRKYVIALDFAPDLDSEKILRAASAQRIGDCHRPRIERSVSDDPARSEFLDSLKAKRRKK